MQKHFGIRKIYALDHPKASISEAFRMLRTNLMFTNVDKQMRSILLTSAGPGEGKSTTIANLAVVLAQTGKRVLVMDCDLRKPVQQEIFKLNPAMGMTNYLAGLSPWQEVVQSTQVPNLSVMTSGPIPPNPAELLGAKVMDEMLQKALAEYDHVLLDAPPVMAVADPLILAVKCDGVILVVRAGYAKTIAVKESWEVLHKSGAHLIGTVLNDVDFNGRHYAKRYGRYYENNYSQYYHED